MMTNKEMVLRQIQLFLPMMREIVTFLKTHPNATYPYKQYASIEDLVAFVQRFKAASQAYSPDLPENQWFNNYIFSPRGTSNRTIDCLEKLAYALYGNISKT